MLAQATLVAFVATAAPDRARAFYAGTLGLRLVSEDPFALVFDGGGVGVVFERFGGMPQDAIGIWTSPSGARITWFKDPDGNLLSVAEP